jgi:uncharacterized protein YjaG (DUF416 family)
MEDRDPTVATKMTATLKYDERMLKHELDQLPWQASMAFAASCAQRLADAYRRFAAIDARGDALRFDRVMDYLWSCVLTADNDRIAAETLEGVMSLLVDEQSPGWTTATGYAQDALTSLAYSIRYMLSHDTQEAVWAARCVYEAVDTYVIERDDIDTNLPDAETQILRDPVVQAELARQARDLGELKAVGSRLSEDFLATIRQRSIAEQSL